MGTLHYAYYGAHDFPNHGITKRSATVGPSKLSWAQSLCRFDWLGAIASAWCHYVFFDGKLTPYVAVLTHSA